MAESVTENHTVTERLLASASDIWGEYMRHPFVLGLQNGTLPRENFRYYIIQDYMYLIDYAKVFAIGVAKAKSVETANLFAAYITAVQQELNIHNGYMGRLNITQKEIAATPCVLDNLSYTSYMLRVAYEEGEAQILAAILSCAYSYEVIARQILANNPAAADDEFYGEWVRGYASDEYAEENRTLIAAMNAAAADCTEAELAHLEEIFVACSRYELAFWEMGQKMSK